MLSGFAAIKMINSAGAALYLGRCAELLPQLSLQRFHLFKKKTNKPTSISFILCPLPIHVHHNTVLRGLYVFSAVITTFGGTAVLKNGCLLAVGLIL